VGHGIPATACPDCHFIQVIKYLADHCQVFDTGDELELTTAFAAGCNVDFEYCLSAVREFCVNQVCTVMHCYAIKGIGRPGSW